MQQLLGDRASVADSTFLRELFLQRLPSNVRMVLASTSHSRWNCGTRWQNCRSSSPLHYGPPISWTFNRNWTTTGRSTEIFSLANLEAALIPKVVNPAQSIPIAGITKSLVITHSTLQLWNTVKRATVKRAGQPLAASGLNTCRLLHITERSSKLSAHKLVYSHRLAPTVFANKKVSHSTVHQ